MNEIDNAAAALELLRQTVSSIDDGRLGSQTPCRDYDITALAEHVVGSITRISAAAGVVVPPSDHLGVLGRLAETGVMAVAGWRSRGLAGDVDFGGRTLSARDLLGVIALEFVVHGWDFAVSVEHAHDYVATVPDDLAGDLLQLAHRTITPASRRLAGFDEPVTVGGDATPLDRLLAATGRNPAVPTLLR
jgi:uncharacterized protein (TIGR03086 family)